MRPDKNEMRKKVTDGRTPLSPLRGRGVRPSVTSDLDFAFVVPFSISRIWDEEQMQCQKNLDI